LILAGVPVAPAVVGQARDRAEDLQAARPRVRSRAEQQARFCMNIRVAFNHRRGQALATWHTTDPAPVGRERSCVPVAKDSDQTGRRRDLAQMAAAFSVQQRGPVRTAAVHNVRRLVPVRTAAVFGPIGRVGRVGRID
jgi:hypothetical protein